jgi:hypothetical protein
LAYFLITVGPAGFVILAPSSELHNFQARFVRGLERCCAAKTSAMIHKRLT